LGKVPAVKVRQPLGYCLQLEYALADFYGHDGPWHQSAGSFNNPTRVRAALRGAAKAIRKRLDSIITADDRLNLLVDSQLASIERSTNRIKKGGSGLLEVLAGFISLNAALLGYDWKKGVPNREVVYFQTKAQQSIDDLHRHPQTAYPVGKMEHEMRTAIVQELYAKGVRVSQIARAINQPESRVKDILVRAGTIKRKLNVKATENP
jgi:hypothetical protein